ncbi:MAG: ASKHA domain-containing protein [Kiritimatiellae bacterium]|nr:ASKHA domain-containing protein [Kiritimatiellia bacterium]
MKLIVHSTAGRREYDLAPGVSLDTPLHLDTRCGGRGVCHRCRVELRSGAFETNGKPTAAPASVNACQTRLLSETGEIFVPDGSLAPAGGQIDFHLIASGRHADPVLALDIGTTTIAAALIADGRVVAAGGTFNRQFKFGDNVASRISAASAGKLGDLQQAVWESARETIRAFPRLHEVRRVAIAGNTVMTCLWHGIDPTPIGSLPFTPPCRVFPSASAAASIGLDVPLLTMPAISGYVGGDLTGGVWVTGLSAGEMLVDIGTNCEIVLHAGARVVCAAAAAGPAFEGAGIACGCRATPGAIEAISPASGGGLEIATIGNRPAIGICGSALVDFLAHGPLTGMGRLKVHEPIGSLRGYRLNSAIYLTESDIEQVMKAKAAVCAGILTLLEHAGMSPGDLRRIHLAGGFARHLNLKSAVAIGMLPEGPYQTVGNTSLASAARLALEPESMPELVRLIDRPTEIPLNTIPSFSDRFIDALALPHVQ